MAIIGNSTTVVGSVLILLGPDVFEVDTSFHTLDNESIKVHIDSGMGML